MITILNVSATASQPVKKFYRPQQDAQVHEEQRWEWSKAEHLWVRSYLLPSTAYQQTDEMSHACLYQSHDSSELSELKKQIKIIKLILLSTPQQLSNSKNL